MTTCGHVVCGSHASEFLESLIRSLMDLTDKKGECTYCHATNINAFCLEAGVSHIRNFGPDCIEASELNRDLVLA